jgi:hypothetical protein
MPALPGQRLVCLPSCDWPWCVLARCCATALLPGSGVSCLQICVLKVKHLSSLVCRLYGRDPSFSASRILISTRHRSPDCKPWTAGDCYALLLFDALTATWDWTPTYLSTCAYLRVSSYLPCYLPCDVTVDLPAFLAHQQHSGTLGTACASSLHLTA